jgi:hypothetical protein
MHRFAPCAVVATLAVLTLGAVPAGAAASERATSAAATDISAQGRSYRAQRPRTQLRVYPRYPRRHFHMPYPVPYPVEYPGPNAVRHCDSRLVPEYRPSGTVIVPRTRCWWARG